MRANEPKLLTSRFQVLLVCVSLLCSLPISAADRPPQPRPFQHQITGLFSPDRAADLREVFSRLPQFKLVSVDYNNAEATIEYDPAIVFPGAKPEQIVERLHNELGNTSHGTFGVKPLRVIPREKLTLIEIPVEGLDCKGCSFAAYQLVYRLPGVESATVNFKVGMVTALIDSTKTNKGTLETALKQGGVEMKAATKGR